MKKQAAFALLLLLLLVTSFAQRPVTRLDSLLNLHQQKLAGRAGGMVVILQRNSSTIYQYNSGGFDENRVVPIASASKWYAGLVLMRLVHTGKLSLDDKVSRYIPSFTGEKKDITIRQCFALTSGLPGSSETLTEVMGNRRQTFAALADSIASIPLVAKPGSQMNYGGLSMQVVGRVCEIATGKSWNELFRQEVTGPLGLTATYYGGYRIGAIPRIAGGVLSNAADYLKVLEMLAGNGMYKGKLYLSKEEVDLMLANQTGNAAIGYSPFSKYKSYLHTTAPQRYGIGNWVVRDGPVHINTSPGAFGFTPWIDRERGYYGVIAVRSAFEKVMPVFWQMLEIINQEQL